MLRAGAVALLAGLAAVACGDDHASPAAEAIAFSRPGGTFDAPFELELSAPAELYYTLDGSIPSPLSTPYAGPIAVDGTTLVRAVTVAPDGTREVVSHAYVRLAGDVADFSSNLPLLVVHTLDAAEPSSNGRDFVPAVAIALEPGDAGRTTLLSEVTLESRAGVKVRGRSTRGQPKTSFTLELWGLTDEDDVARPMLGMPAQSDWVLLAPYEYDRSMLRDVLMYALSNQAGRYAPRTRYAELFLEDRGGVVSRDSYRGIYVVIEKPKRDPMRIDVQALDAADVTEPAVSGGYVVKIDEPDGDEVPLEAAGETFVHVYPKDDRIVPAQRDYLRDYIERSVRALEADDGVDPASGLRYESLIDVDSWIDHHVLNAFAKNPDALRLSAFFHKDRGGPLAAGPLWDFDRSMDSYDGRDDDPEGFSATGDGTQLFEHGFWGAFFARPELRMRYVARFRQLLAGPLSAAVAEPLARGFAAELPEAQARNLERWPQMPPRDGSYAAELQHLLDWMAERRRWLGDNLDPEGLRR